MRIRGKIIIVFMCFIWACNSSNEERILKTESQMSIDSVISIDSTKLFGNYLQNKHDLSLTANQHCYVIIPAMGCGLCINSTINHMLANFGKLDTNKITFIVSNGKWLNDSTFNSIVNYKIDKAQTIDGLDLHIMNVTLIYTNNSEIDSIKSVSSEEAQNIIQYCPQRGK